jgi:hypothetical protein
MKALKAAVDAGAAAKPPLPAEKAEEAFRLDVVQRFSAYGVTVDRILRSLGVKVVAAITIRQLVILYGSGAALKKGTATVDELFPLPEAAPATDGAAPTTAASKVAAAAAGKAGAVKTALKAPEPEPEPEPADEPEPDGPAPSPTDGW